MGPVPRRGAGQTAAPEKVTQEKMHHYATEMLWINYAAASFALIAAIPVLYAAFLKWIVIDEVVYDYEVSLSVTKNARMSNNSCTDHYPCRLGNVTDFVYFRPARRFVCENNLYVGWISVDYDRTLMNTLKELENGTRSSILFHKTSSFSILAHLSVDPSEMIIVPGKVITYKKRMSRIYVFFETDAKRAQLAYIPSYRNYSK